MIIFLLRHSQAYDRNNLSNFDNVVVNRARIDWLILSALRILRVAGLLLIDFLNFGAGDGNRTRITSLEM